MLTKGDIVRAPQFPETVEINCVEMVDEYFVNISAVGRESNQYYELMIERHDIERFIKLNDNNVQEVLNAQELQMYLQYYAFLMDTRYSSKRALGNSKLIPLPHQIEAVYSRMLQTPQVRFLLADDPGAGKTIMSGMLIKEMKARDSIQRVLILVPPLVLKQWQEELSEKFSERFFIINRSIVKQYASKNPFLEHDLCLASVYWAAREDVKGMLSEADFDLVIVDEAHKMAAYTHGTINKKTSKTKLYQLGEMLLRRSEHCILLTATPHKGDVENFRHLMKLVDGDIFSSISVNETLREKANPFIIRRLKENIKNFDGTPLFPKRTVKTVQYELSEPELQLYEDVTEYVRHHFNRAINSGSNSTAFAMMLLQRRLSSSIAAIDLSLRRRRKRLQHLLELTVKERKKLIEKTRAINLDEYSEEALDLQEKIEQQLEYAVDLVDPEELQIEIDQLHRLVKQTTHLKKNENERKYDELERTLFGLKGLLNQGEKLLLFTESADTLEFLEKRLLERLPNVAKIVGEFSMDERRKQVELFRNECQVMVATDAGGESINLQFCNQMINYDIPWNPNRLEQRMGRIHRIGQKNDVAVFNLVASNTREGDVMIRLLDKMDRMRSDLGSDLVYDFIGEIFNGEDHDLPSLMQAAILERENLDDLLASMERTISEEHKRLLEFVKQERLAEDSFDLPKMRREQYDLAVSKLSHRSYAEYTEQTLTKNNVRIYSSNQDKVKRIDRMPKYIRDLCRSHSLPYSQMNEGIRFTPYSEYIVENIMLLSDDHPLFRLSMLLAQKDQDKLTAQRFMVSYPIQETMTVDVYLVNVADGTGKELDGEVIFVARREDGSVIRLDNYWLFEQKFIGEPIVLDVIDNKSMRSAVIQKAIVIRDRAKSKRERYLNRVLQYLDQTFMKQMNELMDRRAEYQRENHDNRNSALINQLDASLIDIELRKESRITQVERQKNITMRPPKRIMQLEVVPKGSAERVLSVDYKDIVEAYERQHGRSNVKMFDSLARVDFYSERFNGEQRYIILTENKDFYPSEAYLEDLTDIAEHTFVYHVQESVVVGEQKLARRILV
ncbi:DEAD/DEAH box helicase [Paenibacillus silagei]|uniref:Superfamily II DNA or RNA helicase n=1 Tax=Paenibacillus silagei TaxID=1670801 RepID=A0ABS4NXB4_9BACL|nr:helicase-related protein [Paenibacillus silagei]MBP2114085.1 superfamily II DNA or RNA helicase [Paenibacillus silagei]